MKDDGVEWNNTGGREIHYKAITIATMVQYRVWIKAWTLAIKTKEAVNTVSKARSTNKTDGTELD
jgi:hypothetical protein